MASRKSCPSSAPRVLIIVDDLGRLDANELLAVLKTVRLLGGFPGIHYPLACDQITINDVLSTTAVVGNSPSAHSNTSRRSCNIPSNCRPLQRNRRYWEVHAALAATAANEKIDVSSVEVDKLIMTQAFLDQIPESDLMTLRSTGISLRGS
ncbi:P-loop NTPase fold protein [Nocardia sp. NBC_00511]|uniref:P-loop NTPase fold protein n=1 Tax=Nocardia sp. NBC_00511 TaxID=2903591 RepID=UPI002F908D28